MNRLFLENLLKSYLLEDIYYSDVTTESICKGSKTKALIKAKEDFIVAGLIFIKPIFDVLKEEAKIEFYVQEGQFVKAGSHIAVIEAKDSALLQAERLILNIIGRLSGIATKTKFYSHLIKDYKAKIVETRKTTPGFRYFEKYAVLVGGGLNHRIGLFDAILIKDNHIKIAGSITKAVELARKTNFMKKIEVETSNIEEVKEAVSLKVDVVMLDNMDVETIQNCVSMFAGEVLFEASGNVNEDNIVEIAKTGVDFISSGSIIHHAVWVDVNMKIGV
ncbi:MAG: carboxylating nicotinate-nucleotide diphosphorylase [Desulfurella sp.]|uniref:carboxylating nicotinate-nucleotide diphosphorylase n=1 Tax=Desulfurella sp. TaxID=1962857 RepID=UPI003D1518BC